MLNTSNAEVAKLLRSVAAAVTIKKGNTFQIRAYENAADSIEHSTAEIKDLWEEGKLDLIPGVGVNLREHLAELFKTGKVKHFESLMKDYPSVLFDMLDIPGVGPKTALLVSKMGVKSLEDLKHKLEDGTLVKKGLSNKIAKSILAGLGEESSSGRMLLPYASALAEKVLIYLKKGPGVRGADPLGSLRRRVATIGDLDFAAAAENTEAVVDYFVKMPNVARIIDQGEYKATVMLSSGQHVDLLVGKPESYGALLQHFTGGKNHNIHLRTYAEKHGLSLSEVGIKHKKTGKVVPCRTEEEFYALLKMDTPAPEIREDSGEIEAALRHELPKLIEAKDIKGDLHIHTNYPLDHPSHGPGVDEIEVMVKRAQELGYEYIGISDHPPAKGKHTEAELVEIIEKRTKIIQKIEAGTKGIHVLNGLEIDIQADGSLSVPDDALKTLDYCIAGIHSGHRGSSEDITNRILKALESPYVDIISHPTGRLLNQRPSFDADWEKILEYCGKHKKILEINAFPDRLDLRDDLVREALKYGVKFVIDSDAHALEQMENMPFGVSVARRGWVEEKDVVNAWDFKRFAEWFDLG
jgi:DNA polymerase (family X)